MISQPWSDYAFLDAALHDKMSSAMRAGAAQAVDFVGPMMLGILLWEIVSLDLSSLLSLITDLILKQRANDQKRGNLARSISTLSIVSRLSALACIAVYLVFTRGSKVGSCNTLPLAMIALGAVSFSLAIISALLRMTALSHSTLWSKFLFIFLALITVAATFACIATWKGTSQDISASCSLSINMAFGFFYLSPLLALLFAPLVLRIAPSASQSKLEDAAAAKPTEADVSIHAANIPIIVSGGEGASKPEESPPSTSSPNKDSWSQKLWKAQQRTDDDTTYDDVDHDHSDILRHCLAWWFALLVLMLIGSILAFSSLSPFWIVTYYPISVAFCVLFIAQICRPIKHHSSTKDADSSSDLLCITEQDKQSQDKGEVTQPRPRLDVRRSSLRPRSGTLEEQIMASLSPNSQGRPISRSFKRDRKSSLYHLRGNSLREQINRIAKVDGPSRISEDTERNASGDLNRMSVSSPPNALLAGVPEVPEKKQLREGVEEGSLGLIISPDKANEEEMRPKRSSVSSTVTSSSLTSKPRRKAPPKEEETASSSSSTNNQDESPASHSASIHQEWTKTSIEDSTTQSKKGKEIQSTSSASQMPASPAGSHQELFEVHTTEGLGQFRSISPRSPDSPAGFVSASNEPWQKNSFAKRSSALIADMSDKSDADVVEE